MEKDQAVAFVQNLLDHLVVKAEVSSLSQFYQPDVVGHFGDIDFGFADIENRCDYLNKVYKDRSHMLHELILADDKIIFRDRQIMAHRKTEELFVSEVTAVYSMKNNKVFELWLMVDKNIDYRETPACALANTVPDTFDDTAKQHFQNLISEEKYLIRGTLQSVNLTDREFDVLFYTMRGLTAKETGKKLHISFRTVETHLETLKEKFDCNTKPALRRKIAPGAVWL